MTQVSPRRWFVLGAFMAVSAMSQLMWLAYSSIAPSLQRLAGVSSSRVVLLATCFPLLYVPLSIPVGRFIDRWGYRRAVAAGAVLTAAGAFARIVPTNYTLLLAGSAVMAAGQPFIINSITKLSETCFPRSEYARVNGLFTVSLFAGMMLAMFATPALFHAFGGTGTRNSLVDLALVYGILAAVSAGAFLVASGGATDLMGTRGAERTSTEESLAGVSGGPGSSEAIWASIRRLLRIPSFGALLLVMSAGLGALIAFLQLVEALLQSKGIADTTAGTLGSLFVLTAGVGAFAVSAVVERTGHLRGVMTTCLAISCAGSLSLAVARGSILLGVAGVVTSIVVAAMWPLTLTASEVMDTGPLAGMAASLLLLVGNVAGVVVTFVMEQLHQGAGHNRSYTSAAVFLAAFCAAGIVPALRLRLAPASHQRETSTAG